MTAPSGAAGNLPERRDTRVLRAEVRERALEDLLRRTGGLDPRALVEEARSPEHPLHEEFEWDDKKAASAFRVAQALRIIIASAVVNRLKEQEAAPRIRRYLPSYTDGVFKARQDVLAHPLDRKLVVGRFVARLEGWCRSVIDIEELEPLRLAVQAALTVYEQERDE